MENLSFEELERRDRSSAPRTRKQATEAELLFLRFLGSWTERHFGRKELLRRYLSALDQRVRWDGIDERKVRQYVIVELKGVL